MKKRIIFLLLIISLISVSCTKTEDEDTIEIENVSNVETQEIDDIPVEVFEESLYSTYFSEPIIVGSSRVIIGGEITSKQRELDIKDIKASLLCETEVESTYMNLEDNKIYAVFDDVSPNKEYCLNILIDDEKEVVLDNQLIFKIPSRIKSVSEVESDIDNLLSGQIVDENNCLLLETQACMNLLGLETDEIGTYGFLTQANIVRLEYSFNSYGSFVDYSHIYGQPTKELLDILKSILCVSGENSGEYMILEFEVRPHTMTDYAKLVLCEENYSEFCNDCGDFCGKIDVDRYIYELAKENEQVYERYKELPFIIETQEFEDKYGEKNLSKKNAETEEAKNKAIFSMYESKWIKNVAFNTEKMIAVAGADDDSISLKTMIALAYMAIDAYHETGQVFMVRSGYRDYNLQEKIHYQVMQKSEINYWRDLIWYKQRQKVSAVPGFSNHQYGFAIDFEGKYNYGIRSFTEYQPELYTFLLKKGPSYGFYRNSSESWHWAYLGKTFD